MSADHELVLISGTANEPLAKEIGIISDIPVHYPITRFANGEARAIDPFVRGREVYIIQSTYPDVDRSYAELYLIADAAKRAKAKKITSIMPYFGYGRQDRKDQPHSAISAKVMARNIEANKVDHFVTVDIHSEQTEGFFDIYYDNLQASYCFIPRLRQLGLSKKTKFVSPDLGGGPRAGAYDSRLPGKGIAMGYKVRDYNKRNTSSTSLLVGNVRGYDTVVVDDQIDTAGSLLDITKLLKEKGALRIFAVATHGVLSNPALDRIKDSPIERLLITNSIRQPEEVLNNPKIEVLSLAPLLWEVIRRIHMEESVGEGLID